MTRFNSIEEAQNYVLEKILDEKEKFYALSCPRRFSKTTILMKAIEKILEKPIHTKIVVFSRFENNKLSHQSKDVIFAYAFIETPDGKDVDNMKSSVENVISKIDAPYILLTDEIYQNGEENILNHLSSLEENAVSVRHIFTIKNEEDSDVLSKTNDLDHPNEIIHVSDY